MFRQMPSFVDHLTDKLSVETKIFIYCRPVGVIKMQQSCEEGADAKQKRFALEVCKLVTLRQQGLVHITHQYM